MEELAEVLMRSTGSTDDGRGEKWERLLVSPPITSRLKYTITVFVRVEDILILMIIFIIL